MTWEELCSYKRGDEFIIIHVRGTYYFFGRNTKSLKIKIITFVKTSNNNLDGSILFESSINEQYLDKYAFDHKLVILIPATPKLKALYNIS